MPADPTYNVPNYAAQGSKSWVIGGELRIVPGGKITADGTQAALIANPVDATTTQAAVISILTALKGVGIIASS